MGARFQSTRPVRGATSWRSGRTRRHEISIHAPRAGRDTRGKCCAADGGNFNPRAPCGARPEQRRRCGCLYDFNPRAPCGARLLCLMFHGFQVVISIHAPRAGRDNANSRCDRQNFRFQSTRPVRGATFFPRFFLRCAIISIHAPRAGRDRRVVGVHVPAILISIHAPRAGRDREAKADWKG